ncbi:MAG: hypothetical protein LBM96_01665 [Methanobrevibacter sp.]|jgi:tetratricopeptide (TPR) repeat protein|nr:hypothetical protein [Candidatus Methanoflexus mossambicus]
MSKVTKEKLERKLNKALKNYLIDELKSLELIDDAFEILDDGLKIDPNNIILMGVKTELLYDYGHTDEAYNYINSFSEGHEKYDDILEIKAKLNEYGEDFEGALEIYTKILENGKSSHALNSKVDLMMRLKFDDDEILKFLETFYDNEYLRDTAIMFAANFYFNTEGGEKALSFYEKLYDGDLENPKYKSHKADILFEMGKFDEAEKYMGDNILFEMEKFHDPKKYIMDSFKNGGVHGIYISTMDLASSYIENGDYDSAIKLLDTISKDSKEYEAIKHIKKDILNKKERQKENYAEKFLEKNS